MALVLTVSFLWAILVFSFCFYGLTKYFLRKKSKRYFQPISQTLGGQIFLSGRNLIRNFARGAVFFFLYENYLA